MKSSPTLPFYDALTVIRQQKQRLRKDIRASKQRISDTTHTILAPMPKATSRAHAISQLVSHGMAIYEGLRIGMSLISALRSTFGRGRRKR